ncbi:DUF6054 family protein [Bacillus tuaregi]|uniref:DUF6054 family protein n=1 Tax=Bacillus tuaregi TaxID=1816695 RepID=UPI0008F802E3|nr:DUF6054 family protein [Bacillus tuaregi]
MQNPIEFKISLSPFEAANMILSAPTAKDDLVYWEHHLVGDEGKQICTFIFERYYFRTSGRATLTVILENFDGENKVRCIPSGSAESLFNVDFGASKNFIDWIRDVLKEFVLKEPHE